MLSKRCGVCGIRFIDRLVKRWRSPRPYLVRFKVCNKRCAYNCAVFVFDINALVSLQATLVGCNVYTRENLEEAVRVISDGSVDVGPLVSRIFPLDQCKEAFALLNSQDKSVAKVLFQP